MTTLILIVFGCWLALLTCVIVLIFRQLALITERLEFIGPGVTMFQDGPADNTELPDSVATPLALKPEAAWIILLSATCSTCHDIAGDFAQHGLPSKERWIALVPGEGGHQDELIRLLPDAVDVITGDTGYAVSSELQIERSPFLLAVHGNRVIGKAPPLLRPEDVRDYVMTTKGGLITIAAPSDRMQVPT